MKINKINLTKVLDVSPCVTDKTKYAVHTATNPLPQRGLCSIPRKVMNDAVTAK